MKPKAGLYRFGGRSFPSGIHIWENHDPNRGIHTGVLDPSQRVQVVKEIMMDEIPGGL